MIDRVRICDTNHGDIRISQSDDTGIDMAVCIVPRSEWTTLRNKVVASVPANFQFTDAITYMTGLLILLEQS